MKFSVSSEHRDYYQKNSCIEFEGLLNASQLGIVENEIQKVFSRRLNVPTFNLHKMKSDSYFMQGHDLWRSNELIKKTVNYSLLAEITSELLDFKPIRLGCDQFFPAYEVEKFFGLTNKYNVFLNNQVNLEEFSSLQGIIGGVMVCVKGNANKIKEEETPNIAKISPIDIFPTIAGNGIFFNPVTPIDFRKLHSVKECEYIMITFVRSNAVYILQEKDPFVHQLKDYGYALGDKLSDKKNPILYR